MQFMSGSFVFEFKLSAYFCVFTVSVSWRSKTCCKRSNLGLNLYSKRCHTFWWLIWTSLLPSSCTFFLAIFSMIYRLSVRCQQWRWRPCLFIVLVLYRFHLFDLCEQLSKYSFILLRYWNRLASKVYKERIRRTHGTLTKAQLIKQWTW